MLWLKVLARVNGSVWNNVLRKGIKEWLSVFQDVDSMDTSSAESIPNMIVIRKIIAMIK